MAVEQLADALLVFRDYIRGRQSQWRSRRDRPVVREVALLNLASLQAAQRYADSRLSRVFDVRRGQIERIFLGATPVLTRLLAQAQDFFAMSDTVIEKHSQAK